MNGKNVLTIAIITGMLGLTAASPSPRRTSTQ